jgi:hypothetical protein
VTACQVIEGNFEVGEFDINSRRQAMDDTLSSEGLVAFSKIHVVPNFESGIIDIAQANGFAGLQANTAMFGWPGTQEGLEKLLRVMRALSRIGMSTIIVRLPYPEGPLHHQTIDVWWRGKQQNGDLMLLLAHLLIQNHGWRRAEIVLRTIVQSKRERQPMAKKLDELISDVRIKSRAEVLVRPPEMAFSEVFNSVSQKVGVSFLGLKIPDPGEETDYASRLNQLADGRQTIILVRNAGPFAGKLIE